MWILRIGPYLLAEALGLGGEGRGGPRTAHLAGHGAVHAVGRPELLLGQQLQHQRHILLALSVRQTLLGPAQGMEHLLQLWTGDRQRDREREMERKNERERQGERGIEFKAVMTTMMDSGCREERK